MVRPLRRMPQKPLLLSSPLTSVLIVPSNTPVPSGLSVNAASELPVPAPKHDASAIAQVSAQVPYCGQVYSSPPYVLSTITSHSLISSSL